MKRATNAPITLTGIDEAFVKTERIFIPVTQVMKNALAIIAEANHVTVAHIAREALFYFTETKYPEFSEIYTISASSALREITADDKNKDK